MFMHEWVHMPMCVHMPWRPKLILAVIIQRFSSPWPGVHHLTTLDFLSGGFRGLCLPQSFQHWDFCEHLTQFVLGSRGFTSGPYLRTANTLPISTAPPRYPSGVGPTQPPSSQGLGGRVLCSSCCGHVTCCSSVPPQCPPLQGVR